MRSSALQNCIEQLDVVVYCAECDPPVAVEVPVGVFYRLRDHDLVRCPNGHAGTLLQYKTAGAQATVRCGPFLRQPPGPSDQRASTVP